MRAVVQRVSNARVKVSDEIVGSIENGLLVLIAAAKDDGPEQIKWMVDKLVGLRIFSDENEKLNLSLDQVGGSMLIVSQFTLYGDCRKGRRPSYSNSAPPEEAEEIYNQFIEAVKSKGVSARTGRFGAMMMVELVNDGPVTLILDSPQSKHPE